MSTNASATQVSPPKRPGAAWIAIGVTALIAALGWVDRFASSTVVSARRLDDHDRRLGGVELTQRVIERDLAEMRSDLKWIRRELEGRRP